MFSLVSYNAKPEVYRGHRRKAKMTPRLMDWILNGVPVYIRRRPVDGALYATAYDFSRFLKEEPEATVRVKITAETARDFDPETAPEVLAKLAELRK